ncbi:MAG TPA: hypothetical protein DF863_06245 [Gammaproteobacteria bacterium]|jgi:hypothetical protein|nr:hypothetical protein [Gammaproteobacteria bacterium]
MFTATNERVQCSITIESQQFNNNQPSAIDRIKISTRPIFTKPDKKDSMHHYQQPGIGPAEK